ncbi:MAG: hypothetical protein PHI40_05870, partial [Caldisericia bacterium]|nr:hypothetical protein [Caldisericia bacterium]
MQKKWFSVLLSLCLLFTVFSPTVSSVQSSPPTTPPKSSLSLEQANQVLQSTPSYFTENKGQWHPDILFAG